MYLKVLANQFFMPCQNTEHIVWKVTSRIGFQCQIVIYIFTEVCNKFKGVTKTTIQNRYVYIQININPSHITSEAASLVFSAASHCAGFAQVSPPAHVLASKQKICLYLNQYNSSKERERTRAEISIWKVSKPAVQSSRSLWTGGQQRIQF